MSKNLVIVESPAKAKTIQKYLGKDFEVMASFGHVRDLVPKDGAVDTANGFTMNYQVIERNEKHVRAIGAALKGAEALYLATDPDREGEAIAWHLTELLKERKLLKGKSVKRVVFYEITEREVQNAIANPREIATDLVNAQQARRALDHLFGFGVSPVLWRKVPGARSAGRVQSPALRLICEREEEIKKFVPQEYWTIEARVEKAAQAFTAKLVEYNGQKLEQFTLTGAGGSETAKKAILAAANGVLKVASVDKKQRRRNPAPPFTTSTLQQEANRKLGFTAKRTMRAAQDLFEGVDIHGEQTGLITYMRTDSVSLSPTAVEEIREVVLKRYGKKSLPGEAREYKTKSKNAQEAHEGVRPTAAARTPEQVAKYLSPDQARLYELIWKRAVASQMEAAVFDTVAVELKAGEKNSFRANGQTLLEAGFLAAYNIKADDPSDKGDDEDEDDKRLPPLEQGETVKLLDVIPEQHFTEPPPRYTEASLVKTLEEYGIGRPSTYATIINTLGARNYVEMQGKAFVPTDLGMVLTGFLKENFTHYVEYEFTAHFEDELDEISRNERDWVPVLAEFWGDFKPAVDRAMEGERHVQERVLGVDPASGKPVSVRLGRFGPFAQIGTKDDADKPRFASLRGGLRLDTISLDQAMELFKLPRKLGQTADGEPIEANIGRFGPYVKFGKQYASLRKEDDPFTITLPRALEVIELKKQAVIAATLKRFEGSPIIVIKGRFGPYIRDDARKARIPKDKDYASLTLEECQTLLDEQNVGKKKGGKKAAKPAGVAAAPAAKTAAKPAIATKRAAVAPVVASKPGKAKKKAKAPAKKKPAAPKAATS